MVENSNIKVDLRPDGSGVVTLAGDWTLESRPDISPALAEIQKLKSVAFDSSIIGHWDSYLMISLERIREECDKNKIVFNAEGLPQGARRLLKLALAVPERAGARRSAEKKPFFERFGNTTLDNVTGFKVAVEFAGQIAIGFLNMLMGRAKYRRADIAVFMQEAGSGALPIVSLISVLVGTILAFVGSIQLKMFGAEIYVASLVGAGMAIEMGALMTGIIMAGRTAASYAAQLGTMQVNEEMDALRTLGLSPFEFLVLPRFIALAVMMPLLCIYADVLGMIGGAVVGIFMLGIEPVQYFQQTRETLTISFFMQGIIKSAAFGMVIAFCGCLQGMMCGRSAQAVGEATTKAVVQCIVWIVVTDTILTLIYLKTGF